MAQRFPRFRERTGFPMDYEAVDENLRYVAEEVEGRLGEQNWDAAAITARTLANTARPSMTGWPAATPKRPASRMVCAALAAAISALDGTQP